jgi:hypothetical protein
MEILKIQFFGKCNDNNSLVCNFGGGKMTKQTARKKQSSVYAVIQKMTNNIDQTIKKLYNLENT